MDTASYRAKRGLSCLLSISQPLRPQCQGPRLWFEVTLEQKEQLTPSPVSHPGPALPCSRYNPRTRLVLRLFPSLTACWAQWHRDLGNAEGAPLGTFRAKEAAPGPVAASPLAEAPGCGWGGVWGTGSTTPRPLWSGLPHPPLHICLAHLYPALRLRHCVPSSQCLCAPKAHGPCGHLPRCGKRYLPRSAGILEILDDLCSSRLSLSSPGPASRDICPQSPWEDWMSWQGLGAPQANIAGPFPLPRDLAWPRTGLWTPPDPLRALCDGPRQQPVFCQAHQ